MEIVIPDLEEDDDDLPLPKFSGHGFGQPFDTSPYSTRSHSLLFRRGRGDSDASIDTPPPPGGFNFPQSGHRYAPPHHQDEGRSTSSLQSPVRPALKQRQGSSSSQSHGAFAPFNTSHPAPFAQASSYGVPKKSSFASLKNAIRAAATGIDKSSNSNVIPPLPSSSAAGYPALKNPFTSNRSGSSNVSPQQSYGGTNRSGDPRPSASSFNTMQRRDRGRKQSSATVHSHQSRPSGYNFTTPSTSQGSLPLESLEPVPSLPAGYAPLSLSQTLSRSTEDAREEETRIAAVPEPRTPGEFALHVLFRRFVACGDEKIRILLARPLNRQPPLSSLLGPGVDPILDEMISSMAYVARKQARPVVDSIMGWCNLQKEGVRGSEVRAHINQLGGQNIKTVDAAAILTERKALAAIYVVNRTLLKIIDTGSKEAMFGPLGASLEKHFFEAYRLEHPDTLIQNPNRREVANMTVDLLGALSQFRFLTISDRFIGVGGDLERLVAMSNPPREAELRADHLVKGMNSFKIRVYPDADLEDSADYLQRMAELFSVAHGSSIKVAFAETLARLLHALPTALSAEVNHPVWAKAINSIHTKAVQLASKSRFWHYAFPLAVMSLCVSPADAFKAKWVPLLEQAMSKIKDRPSRSIAYNSIIRLVWIYLHRCSESSTSTAKRLDTVMAYCFTKISNGSLSLDLPIESLTQLACVILEKDPEYAQATILDMLSSHAITAVSSQAPAGPINAEQSQIAIQAILLTFQIWQDDQRTAWPMSYDFQEMSLPPLSGDLGQPLHAAVLSRPYAADLHRRCVPAFLSVLHRLHREVGQLTIFDDHFSTARMQPSTPVDGTSELITRRHGEVSVAYNKQYVSKLELLRTMLYAIPRCLEPETEIGSIADIISSGTAQVDPDAAQAACHALVRLVAFHSRPGTIILSLTRFLFCSDWVLRPNVCNSKPLQQQQERICKVWLLLLETLKNRISAAASAVPGEHIIPMIPSADDIAEVEAAATVLCISPNRWMRTIGMAALRVTVNFSQSKSQTAYAKRQSRLHVSAPTATVGGVYGAFEAVLSDERTTQLVEGADMTMDQRNTLVNWLKDNKGRSAASLAEGELPQESMLWSIVFTDVIKRVAGDHRHVLAKVQSILARIAHQFQPAVIIASGMAQRPGVPAVRDDASPTTRSDQSGLLEQWRFWMMGLCCLTGDDGIMSGSATHDKTFTMRDLLLLLTPYLSSDRQRYREAAIQALGRVPPHALPALLGHLQKLQSHISDDPKLRKLDPNARHAQRKDYNQMQLFSSISHVYMLVSPLVLDLDFRKDEQAIRALVDHIIETRIYLADGAVKEDFELQRLRRYFCTLVKNVFMALAERKRAEAYMSLGVRGAIFRLCDEWCTLGRRADVAQARQSTTLLAAAERYRADANRKEYMQALQADTKELSWAAGSTMVELCSDAMLTEDSVASPHQQTSRTEVEPLSILQWIRGLFTSTDAQLHRLGRRALVGLLCNNPRCQRLINEVLHQAYAEGERFTLSRCFFSVVVEAQCQGGLKLSFPEASSLALTKLGHPDPDFRLRAFVLLEQIVEPSAWQSIAAHYDRISSSSAKIYGDAQREVASMLSILKSEETLSMVIECTSRVTQLDASRRPLTLSIMSPWLQQVDLTRLGIESVDSARAVLDRVFFLGIRLGQDHPTEMCDLWNSLISADNARNTQPVIVYLLRQATTRQPGEGFEHARRAISHFAGTPASHTIFQALCTLVDSEHFVCTKCDAETSSPSSNLPAFSYLDDILGKYLLVQSVSNGQMAMLFAGQLAPGALVNLDEETARTIAKLLHALVSQVVVDVLTIRKECQTVLFRLLSAWIELDASDDTSNNTLAKRRKELADLIASGSDLFWHRDHDEVALPAFVPQRMAQLLPRIVSLLSSRWPSCRQVWGEQALVWATECTIPNIAYRSFQIFRILMPDVSSLMLSSILSRYSITVAGTSTVVQTFNKEVLHTLCCIVQATSTAELLGFPQLFWCCAAALDTPVEREYQLAVDMLAFLLDKVDISNADVRQDVIDSQPKLWHGDQLCLQGLLLRGLASKTTMQGAFDIIRRLAGVILPELIDERGMRLGNTFIASLPWLLQSEDAQEGDPELQALAEDIGTLAESEDQSELSHIMLSFARRRFKTKEDCIRQSVGCLRAFLPSMGQHIILHLVGLLWNQEDWIRLKSLQILKLLLQDPQAKPFIQELGPEILAPLLRLLTTSLAGEALEVLDLPVVFGVSAESSNVVRMSLTTSGPTSEKVPYSRLFGSASESGWHVPDPETQSMKAKTNMEVVIGTFEPETRARSAHFSTINFGSKLAAGIEVPPPLPSPPCERTTHDTLIDPHASLGDLVGALHDISSFFSEDTPTSGPDGQPPMLPSPRQRANAPDANERKVRAILARSLIRHPSISSIDWTRSGSVIGEDSIQALAALQSHSESTLSTEATDDVDDLRSTNSLTQSSIAEQLSRWRGQSAHAAHASFSSIGSRSMDARSGGSQFDLDEQDVEHEPPRNFAILSAPNRNGWLPPHEAMRPPQQMRNLVLGGDRPQTPRG